MKKNLVTVIILALCLINLVFNILLTFVFMPSAAKTNELITNISEVLDLEIQSQSTGDDDSFDVSNLAAFTLEQGNPINLADDGSGTVHVLMYGLTINLDKTASDYSKVNETLTSSTALVYDTVSDIAGRYTYSQVTDVEVKGKIRDDILTSLREMFNTECIYSVSFYDFVAQ